MHHSLDVLYCYAQTVISENRAWSILQRAHRAVILMAVVLGWFLSGTLLFLLGLLLRPQQDGLEVAFLLLTSVGFVAPYFYLNAMFITNGRYILANKLLISRRFDKETYLISCAAGLVYFAIIIYIAGRIQR